LTKWQVDKVTNGKLLKWQVNKIACWQNGNTMIQQVDEMASSQSAKLAS
jgi:hypothetical protein